MYRLTVVAGPTRGNSYPLHEGETTIGRLSSNGLVLNSGKVSKKHCVLVVSNGEVVVKDQGSANGTFVNGVLAKTPKPLATGDRVSVGEFVLELSQLSSDQAQKPIALPIRLASYDHQRAKSHHPQLSQIGGAGVGLDPGHDAVQMVQSIPTDLKGRALWFFEFKLMPPLYKLLLKHEWSTLLFAAFGVFGLVSIVFVLMPQLHQGELMVIREMERRAALLARVIVESNSGQIQQQQEGRTSIHQAISNARGVRQALLVDLESRIIAPPERLNQYLSEGPAAVAATYAKKQFAENGRSSTYITSNSRTVVAIEPMILFSPKEGKNIPVAMGVVALDASLALQSMGDQTVSYFEAMILLGFFGLIISLAVYRLTLKPLQILHEEVDRSLKGDRVTLTREIRFSELGQLLDVVDTALQRAANSGGSATNSEATGSQLMISDDAIFSYRMLAEALGSPVAICDSERRPVYLNPSFEEVTGVRMEFGESRPLAEMARDQAFGVLLTDLFDRSPGLQDGIVEDFEFSGVPFRIKIVAVCTPSGQARAFVLLAQRMEAG